MYTFGNNHPIQASNTILSTQTPHWNNILNNTESECPQIKYCIPLITISVDHGKEDQIEKLFETIKAEQNGQLDILVNNAYAAVNHIFENMGKPFWEAEPAYSWDIVVQKIGDKIFLDKRDNTEFDLLTVSETAAEPPQDEASSLNSPRNLALEATFVNHNYSQQVLKSKHVVPEFCTTFFFFETYPDSFKEAQAQPWQF